MATRQRQHWWLQKWNIVCLFIHSNLSTPHPPFLKSLSPPAQVCSCGRCTARAASLTTTAPTLRWWSPWMPASGSWSHAWPRTPSTSSWSGAGRRWAHEVSTRGGGGIIPPDISSFFPYLSPAETWRPALLRRPATRADIHLMTTKRTIFILFIELLPLKVINKSLWGCFDLKGF